MSIEFAKRMENIKPSPIRALMHLVQQPGVISFAGGWPAPESFPMKELEEIASKIIRNMAARLFNTARRKDIVPCWS